MVIAKARPRGREGDRGDSAVEAMLEAFLNEHDRLSGMNEPSGP